jgi:hypothetical protein
MACARHLARSTASCSSASRRRWGYHIGGGGSASNGTSGMYCRRCRSSAHRLEAPCGALFVSWAGRPGGGACQLSGGACQLSGGRTPRTSPPSADDSASAAAACLAAAPPAVAPTWSTTNGWP